MAIRDEAMSQRDQTLCSLREELEMLKVNGDLFNHCLDTCLLFINTTKCPALCKAKLTIHVQYSDIMRFLVRHSRHHKVSRSSYVTKLLLFCEELGLGGHYVMPIKCTRKLIMRVYWTTPKSPLLF